MPCGDARPPFPPNSHVTAGISNGHLEMMTKAKFSKLEVPLRNTLPRSESDGIPHGVGPAPVGGHKDAPVPADVSHIEIESNATDGMTLLAATLFRTGHDPICPGVLPCSRAGVTH